MSGVTAIASRGIQQLLTLTSATNRQTIQPAVAAIKGLATPPFSTKFKIAAASTALALVGIITLAIRHLRHNPSNKTNIKPADNTGGDLPGSLTASRGAAAGVGATARTRATEKSALESALVRQPMMRAIYNALKDRGIETFKEIDPSKETTIPYSDSTVYYSHTADSIILIWPYPYLIETNVAVLRVRENQYERCYCAPEVQLCEVLEDSSHWRVVPDVLNQIKDAVIRKGNPAVMKARALLPHIVDRHMFTRDMEHSFNENHWIHFKYLSEDFGVQALYSVHSVTLMRKVMVAGKQAIFSLAISNSNKFIYWILMTEARHPPATPLSENWNVIPSSHPEVSYWRIAHKPDCDMAFKFLHEKRDWSGNMDGIRLTLLGEPLTKPS